MFICFKISFIFEIIWIELRLHRCLCIKHNTNKIKIKNPYFIFLVQTAIIRSSLIFIVDRINNMLDDSNIHKMLLLYSNVNMFFQC